MGVELESSWMQVLGKEFDQEYMHKLQKFLQQEKEHGFKVYPPEDLVYNAFNHTAFSRVKVVILGQDPYHGPNQAHGLAFSVQKGVRIPPSLINVYKEVQSNIEGFVFPAHGDLTRWADQGVLLLNATLTVRAGQPASHHNKGWEIFTDKAISMLSEQRDKLVFLLWGKNAQAKESLIDPGKHYILKAAHPSPYSANNGFFGCRHFAKTNEILEDNGFTPIDWQIV